jgi:hypothetical protein
LFVALIAIAVKRQRESPNLSSTRGAIGGSASFLTAAQEDALKAFVGATPPRSTRQVGAFITAPSSRQAGAAMAGTQYADATLGFLHEQVPHNWAHFCDSVTDNFRVISPKNSRVMT